MKFKFTCSAWSNITYRREEVVELDIDPEEWEEGPEGCKGYVDEQLREWVNDDLSFDFEVHDEETRQD